MLSYQYDDKVLQLKEAQNGSDIEFHIQLNKEKTFVDRIQQVWHYFDSNKDYTDVLFYAYPNHLYKVIVRKEHYVDFLTELFKVRLLRQLEWTRE